MTEHAVSGGARGKSAELIASSAVACLLTAVRCVWQAVNLEIPKSLESTVGDHHNFLATVMYRGNSIDEED